MQLAVGHQETTARETQTGCWPRCDWGVAAPLLTAAEVALCNEQRGHPALMIT